MTRALIIDDEKTARADLRAMLAAAHPEIEIVGEAATVNSARALLASADYTLVFLDIQIVGGSGFDVVPQVRAGAKIIFVTAHNEHAVRAFEVNALDYLLKPVKATRLAAALARLARPVEPAPDVAGPALRADDIVQLISGAVTRFAPLAEISAIRAEENYSLIQLIDGSNVLVRRSLKAWEDMLPAGGFMRVHRTVILNLARLTGFRREPHKAISVQVQGLAESLPVSRPYWAELKTRLPRAMGLPEEE